MIEYRDGDPESTDYARDIFRIFMDAGYIAGFDPCSLKYWMKGVYIYINSKAKGLVDIESIFDKEKIKFEKFHPSASNLTIGEKEIPDLYILVASRPAPKTKVEHHT